MPNLPAIKFPQTPFLDNQGNLSRAWRDWLLNPQFITLNLGTVLAIDSGGTGVTTSPASGQLLIGNIAGGYTLSTLTAGTSIGITNGDGHITVFVQNVDAALINSGTLSAARLPAFTGDITTAAGSSATTLATVNATPGAYGDAAHVATYTVNAKGLVTLSGQVAIAIANTAVSGLGTLSTQNANAVAITGGSISGTTFDSGAVGATTPSTVKGTTVTATGAFGCNGKAAQTAAAVNAAVAGTAGVVYTATEQGIINALVAQINLLRTALINNGIAV